MSRADLTLLLICAIWGTTFALLRDALHAISPGFLVAIRFTIASLILAVVNFRRLRTWRPEWIRDGLLIGTIVAVGYITQVIGLRTVSASRSAFITSMSIAFVPFIAFAVLRTRPVVGEALGVVLRRGDAVAERRRAGRRRRQARQGPAATRRARRSLRGTF